MNKLCLPGSHIELISICSMLVLGSCAGLNDPNNPYGGGYSAPSYGYDDYSYQRERDRQREERHELREDREQLEEDRRRLEEEQRRQWEAHHKPPIREHTQERPPERCPSGFEPSERKCSPEERRRGCKDMRLPGGLGCVHR